MCWHISVFVVSVDRGLLGCRDIFGVGVVVSELRVSDWSYSTEVIAGFLQAYKVIVSM